MEELQIRHTSRAQDRKAVSAPQRPCVLACPQRDAENARARSGGRQLRRQRMSGTIEKKLGELGIVLPTPASPVANYVAFVRTGRMLIVSGQICYGADGKLV